jgi:hypothetical protein
VGRRIDFEEFIRLHGLDLSDYEVPGKRCVLMEEDYRCPQRGRIVLHAGCAYDTPVYLQSIRHKTKVQRDAKVLAHIVEDLEDEEIPLAHAVRGRHEAALASARETVRLVWHPEDESVSCNGETLVKGVPAKILKALVQIYLGEGRHSFEYREFKRDFEISLGQKNSNFEVRLYRLIERLQEKCPALSIVKVGRGRFELRTRCKLEFEG